MKFVACEKPLEDTLTAFYKCYRALYRKLNPEDGAMMSTDIARIVHKYFGSCGAPGSGKTRFLQELADLRLCSDEKLEKYLEKSAREPVDPEMEAKFFQAVKSWVPVLVTYNGLTKQKTGIDLELPDSSLTAHILYS